MGVSLDAPSMADRSKAAGEIAVREALPDANIIETKRMSHGRSPLDV
jgi:hypothetical protein